MNINNREPTLQRFLTHIGLAVMTLATIICLFACDQTKQMSARPIEKVTIAYSISYHSLLAKVAQVKGYFQQEGLEVTPHLHPYGKRALEDMLAGNADFATVAETPVMFAILNGADISIIATIHTTDKDDAILARKDKGILEPRDLKGKKIAVTPGTTSEFFLEAFLAVNAITREEVEMVNLRQEELPQALVDGKVDAASVFNPFLFASQKQLGEGGTTFYNRNIYTKTFVIVSTKEFVQHNPNKVDKILRALDQAEKFFRQNPEEAMKITADFSQTKIDDTREMLAGTNVGLSLDQPLILTLEDESRWAIERGLANTNVVPNYLDYIYFDGLNSIKPAAITILR
jgi:NitT/TauT family transport system substrate-binding protein